MKQKLLLLLISSLFFPLLLSATHIVGGSLTYEQLGGATYRVTLKLYRDCKLGNAGFPWSVNITVTKNNGAYHSTIGIPNPGVSIVPPNIDTCATNPGICLEEAIYSKVVSNLPPSAGGYHLYFQICCRNATLQNIVSPSSAGETWYAHIPDNGVVISNSSPKWVTPPPMFVCQGINMSVNHSATDADGDSLVYSLYTPYSNGAITYPGGIFTTGSITWSGTYGANNPLNAGTPNSLTISANGILNGIPLTIGQFIAGVRCREYRNGVLIGEILRDFQFNVVNCPPAAVANFTSNGVCNGRTITFTNTTFPSATTYFWNFGNGTTLADTSSATNPSYTYPDPGTYTVMLIINKGTPCADTSIQNVSTPYIISDFASDAPACSGVIVNFYDSSTVNMGSSIVSWNWDFGDLGTSTLQNPSHVYNSGSIFNVSLITTSAMGCKDTIVYPVTLIPSPIAAYTSINACPTFPVVFTDSSTSIDSVVSWNWDFGDGSSGSLSTNPSHVYSTGGAYNVSLIISSNNGCVDTLTKTINVYEKPIANFYQNGVCRNSEIEFLDSSTVNGSTIILWGWDFGNTNPNSSSQNSVHTYSTSGTFSVALMVQSAQGCKDTVVKPITILPGPVADFIVDDYAAFINQTVSFTDQSANSPTTWFWDFGDASFNSTSTLQNPLHSYSVGGIYDVCLYVADINSCTDTVCKTEIVSLPLKVPSGFTPNNDGENDIFYVYGGPFKTLDFKIYNNWGELVFETDNQANGWDGKHKGLDQAIGVYIWTIVGVTDNNEKYELSGDVTLLR